MADHLTEEQQVEAIKKWWKENGMAVIAGLVIGSLALFGWRAWGEHQDTKAAEASAIYGEFQKNIFSNNNEEIEKLNTQLSIDYIGTPYAALANLAVAKKAVADNDMAKAKSSLQWVLDNTKQSQVQHTARIRLLALMINDAEYDAALALLAIKNAGGYAGVYEELRGDILLAQGDKAGAYAAYDKALQSDGLSPEARDAVSMKYADAKPTVVKEAETVK